jgi:hypothetical protein
MVLDKVCNACDPIEEARRQVECAAPVPRHEFDYVVHEVLKTKPPAKGQALVDLLAEAALKYWISGMGCC